MTDEQKKAAIKEFDLRKGLLVATFSGVMSACFAYGLAAGDPIKAITVQHGTATLWQGLPVLVVVLAGGFTTNFLWCVILNIRNHTGYQYLQSEIRGEVPKRSEEHILEAVTDAPAEEMAVAVAVKSETPFRAPMLPNYLFSALAGTTWYMQFFFYTMGETQMGHFKFSSWTLHMASIIIFSTLWGIALKEWKGASGKTKLLVVMSLVVLVSSTAIVGYGNYVGAAHRTAVRKQCSYLFSLDSSLFCVIGAERENWELATASEVCKVIHAFIQTTQPIPAAVAALASCCVPVPTGCNTIPLTLLAFH